MYTLITEYPGTKGGVFVAYAGKSAKALYFSRSVIPNLRNHPDSKHGPLFKHIGIYAYNPNSLRIYNQYHQSALEKQENLEQLRWIENGYTCYCIEVEKDTHPIDDITDVEMAQSLMQLEELTALKLKEDEKKI
jgi:CMP-2-keto-3-deoxyoctulosonic acid synthetase